MFNALRMKSGLWYAKFRFRNRVDAVQNFTKAFSDAKEVLLLLPDDPTNVRESEELLSALGYRFSGSRLTVLLGEKIQSLPRSLRTPNLIRLYSDAINKFFVPRKHIVNLITRREYDVAFDLNLDLILPYAYICKESNARFRVGFVKESSDVFYNFQVNSGGDPRSPYRYLAECLEMF